MAATRIPVGMMAVEAQNLVKGAAPSSDVDQALGALRDDIESVLSAGLARGLLEVFDWNGPRAHIPVGALAADGQVFYAKDYPAVAAALEAGKQFTATETAWQAGAKSCWSMGGTDATGRWYRLPKFNGGGGDRAPFLRGSAEGDGGQLVGDAIRDITGSFHGPTNATRFANVEGAFEGVGSANADNGGQLLTGQFSGLNFKASKQVPTASENRPYHATLTVCIRMKTFSPVMN